MYETDQTQFASAAITDGARHVCCHIDGGGFFMNDAPDVPNMRFDLTIPQATAFATQLVEALGWHITDEVD